MLAYSFFPSGPTNEPYFLKRNFWFPIEKIGGNKIYYRIQSEFFQALSPSDVPGLGCLEAIGFDGFGSLLNYCRLYKLYFFPKYL